MISIHIHARELEKVRKLLWVLEGYNEVAKCRYLDWHLWEQDLWESCDREEDCFRKREKAIKQCDILIVELNHREDLTHLRKIRELYLQAELVLLADDKISPEEYVNPYFHPIQILRTPFEKSFDGYIGRKMRQVIQYLLTKREAESFCHRLGVSGISKQKLIPYSAIYCFEANSKKVIIHGSNLEPADDYCFYDSFASLEERLPGIFIRCHRSYIVNSIYIREMDIGKNCVILENDQEVPISRKYNKRFKKAWDKSTLEKSG